MSVRADVRYADQQALSMQFGPGGHPGWTLQRRRALAFSPILAIVILIPTALVGAGWGILVFAGACLIAGHGLHRYLIERVIQGGGG